jgi:hypothetical protein
MKYISAAFMGMAVFVGTTLFAQVHADQTINAAPQAVGKVVFLLGQANLYAKDGSVMPVFRGMDIPEGGRFVVQDRSQVGLRMMDGATEQIRANSVFEVKQYDFDPANPAASEIRLELVEGEVVSKTGKGGQAAKHRYRLNTPIAAIGIRGTEFTVNTTQLQTHVSLRSGAIVMSGFNNGCQRTGLGPCMGGSAETLSEAQQGLALVLQAGQFKPQLIPVVQVNHVSVSQNVKEGQASSSDTKTSDTKTSDTKTSDTKTSDTKTSDTKTSDTVVASGASAAVPAKESSKTSATVVAVADTGVAATGSTKSSTSPVQVSEPIALGGVGSTKESSSVDAAKAGEIAKVAVLTPALVQVETPTQAVITPSPVAGPKEFVIDVSGDSVAPITSPAVPNVPVVAPSLPTSTTPVVKWGRWSPAAGAGAIPLSEQVGKEYALITSNSQYAVTRLAKYDKLLPTAPAVYNFKPGTSEAYIREGGRYTKATVGDARLQVKINNADSASFSTGFSLASEAYNGSVTATGTISKDGIMMDDRLDRATVIQGAVAGDGTTLNSAAYTFYHSINTTQDSFGGIDWVNP